jgi:hypothetical protein
MDNPKFSISFLCCPIMCLDVQSSVLWCRLRFPHKNDVRFVFNSSYLISVICVCLRIVVSNTYCAMFLLCFIFRLVYPRLLICCLQLSSYHIIRPIKHIALFCFNNKNAYLPHLYMYKTFTLTHWRYVLAMTVQTSA